MVAKTDYMSTAIIDYVMSAVSRWFQAGRPASSSKYEYRAFREIEPSVSVLYSFEDGVISSRRAARYIDMWYAYLQGRAVVNFVREFACVAGYILQGVRPYRPDPHSVRGISAVFS